MGIHEKQEWGDRLLELLEPLKPFYSLAGARLRLTGAGACYSRDIIEMEAFSRPLWGLVPFWAGGRREAYWEDLYRRGIIAGTDPDHSEYWGECSDYDQRFVEMAPIALGMLLVPEILWNPLSPEEQSRLAAWLYQINDHNLPLCNWYYFRILVNLALKLRGCAFDRARMEEDLEQMEQYYLGKGWYADGVSGQKDYYSAFAMEFYSQIYAFCALDFSSDMERTRCGRLLSRAAEFGGEFVYWFDREGRGLAYGRSLTYRFAQTAYWSASLFSGSCQEDLGVVKGIINRNLRYWLVQEIFRPDGVLSIGYGYENLTMAERYNGPGSPYWSLKSFLFLALPDDHPYWKACELPLPELEAVHRSDCADMLLQHLGEEVRAYVPAVYTSNVLGHFVEKYAKFVYSSKFAFSVAHSWENLTEAAPDSMLVFQSEEDGRVYGRRRSISYTIGSDRIYSEWSPMEGILVKTELIPVPEGHIRRHIIYSSRETEILAYDCGFAIPALVQGVWSRAEGKTAGAGSPEGWCRTVSLKGEGQACLIQCDPNTHLLHKNTVIPAVCYTVKGKKSELETIIEAQ